MVKRAFSRQKTGVGAIFGAIEGVIRQRQRHRKKYQAASKVLAFVERKDLPARVSM
jgi:hypothetical protein